MPTYDVDEHLRAQRGSIPDHLKPADWPDDEGKHAETTDKGAVKSAPNA